MDENENAPTTALLPAPPAPALWGSLQRLLRVHVHGAAGAVGRELVRALLRSGHPAGGLELYGRSARRLGWRGTTLLVRPTAQRRAGAQLAFLCTPPGVARPLAAELLLQGTRVVDLSGAHAGDVDVPLLAPNAGAEAVGAFTPLVALPEPSTALLAAVLAPLHAAAGIERVSLTLLRSAAAYGARGILAWRRELLEAAAAPAGEERLLGDLVLGAGGAPVEHRLQEELRKLLERPALEVDAICVRAGVERVDGFAVQLGLEGDLSADEAVRLLSRTPGVRCVPGDRLRASDAVGREEVHVGRIRAGSAGRGSLCFFAVGDRLRSGAALAALRVAALLPWA